MVPATNPEDFSRISKLFVDRDREKADRATVRRRRQRVIFACGPELRGSYTLQLALLTAVKLANRCFPGGVRIRLSEQLANARLLVLANARRTLGQELARIVGHRALKFHDEDYRPSAYWVVLGEHAAPENALRLTFDGWVGKVGPTSWISRLPEREFCSIAGVLAGALAVSEIFMSFAEINVEATRRDVALSLWRPDLNADDPEALGIRVEFLPTKTWILGLGHLGQAYLWGLATLPYLEKSGTQIVLNDFDIVSGANVETGILTNMANLGCLKTRLCANWLEALEFKTRLVERQFDCNFRCGDTESRLALCGFDRNAVRHSLPMAGFDRVVECGLGSLAENFDTINLHTLPNSRSAADMWPLESELDETAKRVVETNAAYRDLDDDECGRIQLARKAVAVPFVGAVAASLVLSEVLRLLQGGPAYPQLKIRLATPSGRAIWEGRSYSGSELGSISYGRARKA